MFVLIFLLLGGYIGELGLGMLSRSVVFKAQDVWAAVTDWTAAALWDYEQ